MNDRLVGVMLGILVNPDTQEERVGISLNGEQISFSLEAAANLFDQLGALLESVGYFDENGEVTVSDDDDDVDPTTCNCPSCMAKRMRH